MKNLIHTAVVTLFAASAAHAQQAVQWKVSDEGNGHWYQLIRTGQNAQHWIWSAASAAANARGAHLVTFSSDLESSAVYLRLDLASSTNCVAWIGFSQIPGSEEPGGGWRWVTMERTEFVNWKPGYPDDSGCSIPGEHQDFAVIGSGGDPRWDDSGDPTAACPYGVPFAVIEYDADCNSDGIVDYGQCHDGTLADYNGNNIPDCCERGEACVVRSYPVQWRVGDGGNGHWYDQQTWIGPKSIVDISASYVALIGAHAVTLTSASENEFVYRAVHSRTSDATHAGYSILGGYQDVGVSDYSEPAGGWRWVTGEPMTYLNWGPGFPDNCCYGESVLQYPSASYWNDAETAGVPAGHRYRVIIEWEADCNNDNIVDYGQILNGQLPDSNTNGIPDICEQPQCRDADITNNQIIDGADLGALLAFWGPVNPVLPQADVNRDGQVNGADIGILLSYWGPCPN